MIFIELTAFARARERHLDEEGYRELQSALLIDPKAGVVIPRTGGLRKLRWQGSGRGTRGGLRIIYYVALAHDRFLMLALYGKNERDDISAEQTRLLRNLVTHLLMQWEDE